MRRTGISERRELGVGEQRERPLERRQRQLVRAERALERMPAEPLDEVGAADDDPGLRPAEELVAREADEVGAVRDARRCRRLVPEVEQRPGAEVVDEREPGARRDPGELPCRDGLGEADDAVVRLVHPEDRRRVGADRALVVGRARAVRRPDLDHPRARAGEDVGDPEPVADLDQLAARDDDLAALGQRRDGKEDGGGVVVDDERGLGAGQSPERGGDVGLPRPARARLEVELEVRVRGADLLHACERRRRERRAAEVRVDDHAGRVQHAPQGRRLEPLELGPCRRCDVAGIAAAGDRPARFLERGPRSRERE